MSADTAHRESRWRRFRRDPWALVMRALGTNTWGDGRNRPPGDGWQKILGSPEVPVYASWLDDGSHLWLGYGSQWWGSLSAKDARRLAWFILRRELRLLFGLRRWLWYVALTKHLDDTLPHRRAAAPVPAEKETR